MQIDPEEPRKLRSLLTELLVFGGAFVLALVLFLAFSGN